ncbi:MAG: diaminopimelate decarboxylase [Armatimonadetes bacterium]|nr:diaminopimelate decarboxylase [Armatimonadota bacterium]
MLLGTQRVNERGHLEIGGCDVVDLARRFGTPLYIMDEAAIRENCRRYREAFGSRYPGVKVAYASKAFLCTAMAKIVEQEGLWMDVASGGELYTARVAAFPAERLVFHGNNKSEGELQEALDYGVGRIVVDSMEELERLSRLATDAGKTADILLRCTPGIDPHTHRRIRTGQEDTKFGLGVKSGAALKAIQRARELPGIHFRGVHCHIGSQLLNADTHLEAIEIMAGFLRTIRDETGQTVEEMNIGGGLGIRYLPEHRPPSIEEFAEALTGEVKRRCEEYGVDLPQLGLEPGRSLVGECGTTVYEIGVIKDVPIAEEPGRRLYVSIDGGMSDNPRPQLYDAVYHCLLANRAGEVDSTVVTIAGKHCETDLMIQDTKIPMPQAGDLLAVQSTGAYNQSMASNYNRLTRPPVVLVSGGHADLIVERETYADLVAQDRIPERLKAEAREPVAV